MKVLTIGTFDLGHLGHYNFLLRVKGLYPSCELIVGINRDEFIERFKGKKPLFSFKERFDLISSIDLVDKVYKNYGDEDSKVLIRKVKPDVLVIGSDWLRKNYLKQMNFTVDWLEKNKIALTYIPYTKIADISTTELKRRIKVGDKTLDQDKRDDTSILFRGGDLEPDCPTDEIK